MTTLSSYLPAYYLVGIWLLVLLDAGNHVHLGPAVAAVRDVATRRYRYVGRHWADGLSTMQQVDEKRAARAALTEPTQSLFLPEFDDPAPVSPPYDYGAGSKHYVNLKPRVLDAKVHVDVRALRLRTSSMPLVTEHDDEWVTA